MTNMTRKTTEELIDRREEVDSKGDEALAVLPSQSLAGRFGSRQIFCGGLDRVEVYRGSACRL